MEVSNYDSLSNEELMLLGEEYNVKVKQNLPGSKKDSLIQKRIYSKRLYEIDKILVERGFEDYNPLILDFEDKLRREKETNVSHSYALIAIGVIVTAVSIMLFKGDFLGRAFLIFVLACTTLLIVNGIYGFFREPKTYYNE